MIAGATDYQGQLRRRKNLALGSRKISCNTLKISGKKKVRKKLGKYS